MLIDSHAHLTDRRFRSDLDDVLARAVEAELTAIVTVGAEPADCRAVAKLVAQRRAMAGKNACLPVYGAIGVHPHEARVVTEDVLAELAELARGEGIVAIGETGLILPRSLAARSTGGGLHPAAPPGARGGAAVGGAQPRRERAHADDP